MNNKSIFKAKNKNTGEWMVYGTALHSDKLPNDFDPDTECQFTGINVNEGKRLWENDVVALKDGTIIGVVLFFDGCFVIDSPELLV